jgi:hypothetical protein
MSILLPEILVEARGLSPAVLIAGLAIGLVLWLGGWWSYRFWAVLGTTVIAGVFGLYEAPLLHMQPLLASVLLAIAAGLLALSLMRLAAFAAGGCTCLVLVHMLFPSVHAPMICFLAGGILAILLFRLWMILLTSAAGTLLIFHCGLGLFGLLGNVDPGVWARSQETGLTWACGLIALLGWVIQFFLTRRRPASSLQEEGEEEPAQWIPPPPPKKKETLWSWLPFRRAA